MYRNIMCKTRVEAQSIATFKVLWGPRFKGNLLGGKKHAGEEKSQEEKEVT
jgi:hypothetical protein